MFCECFALYGAIAWNVLAFRMTFLRNDFETLMVTTLFVKDAESNWVDFNPETNDYPHNLILWDKSSNILELILIFSKYAFNAYLIFFCTEYL